MPRDTTPSVSRDRSYSGGYMDAGREAERIAVSWLSADSEVLQVRDVRDQREYQDREIDLLALMTTGKWESYEVKSDKHIGVSGRWLFELFRFNLTAPIGKQFVNGWSVRSQALWLIFYASTIKTIYRIKFDEYRRAFLNASEVMQCSFSQVPTDRIKRTLNGYFPESFVHSMPSFGEFSIAGLSAPPPIEAGPPPTTMAVQIDMIFEDPEEKP